MSEACGTEAAAEATREGREAARQEREEEEEGGKWGWEWGKENGRQKGAYPLPVSQAGSQAGRQAASQVGIWKEGGAPKEPRSLSFLSLLRVFVPSFRIPLALGCFQTLGSRFLIWALAAAPV